MKSQPTSRDVYHRAHLSSMTRIAAFVALVALIAIPLFSSSLASSTSENSQALPISGSLSDKSAAIDSNIFGSFLKAAKQPAFLSLSPQGSETIEIFAADCITANTAFALGETICAKTNGVDLTVPGNYYVNWFHANSTETNGGTITQNPQYFLFALPTDSSEAGTWKVNIGRVAPAESSIIGNPPVFTVSQGPAISTFAYDTLLAQCTNTPKTAFTLGETVCATAVGTEPQFNRRFAWVGPGGITRQFTAITTDPQTDSFTLPSTDTSTINGEVFDNRGTWQARVVTSRGTGIVSTPFTAAAATPSVNLSIAKGLTSGEVRSGEDVTFSVSVYNRGPNDAVNVKITDATPANATFVSATPTAGSGFSCTGSASVVCTGAILKPGQQVTVDFVYTPGAAGQTITNTATVESDTQELDNEDNSATAGPYTITSGGGGGNTCTVACPDDIQTPANTTDGGGNPGAIVHFSPPSGNLACGTVTADHCNDCFFPQGDTVVTGTSADTGESCSFTVTVTAAGSAPTISCPGNKTADADPNVCSTNVNVGTATATGTNVTVTGFRSDGQPMYTCDEFGNCTRNSSDAQFNAGTTTITWYAYAHDIAGPYTAETGDEESHRSGSATCTQTVVVNDVTPPIIGATSSTVSADANCQAVIPDYSSTVTDNCACGSSDDSEACQGHPQIVYTQTPAAGTVVGPGSHNVHIEATDGSSNNNGATKDVTFTVNDTTAPAITCPANVTTNTDPGTCSATVNPGTATATDNCDTTPTIVGTRSDNQALNATYPKGTTTITWRATDDAGNYSECAQTITVEDHENPTISCPANITRNNDPGTCGAVVTYTTPVGSDNCTGATTAQTAGLPSGSTFPVGTTTNTFEVTDSSGNKTSCSFTVTVNDAENPVISCPSSQTLEPTCPSGAVANWTAPVGTDNCPGATTTRTGPAPGTVFAAGTTTTITYTVNDAHGHSASCSFTITVKTVNQTIEDLKISINNSSLSPQNKGGLVSKLQAAQDALAQGKTNVACQKLADFINSTQNLISHGDISAAQGNAWISTAN
ncbi:MAG TPA: HYR domain-containing protein, partial [Pyrinomonadaceae bacterium]|nr:HYR domain-containing protein [Pyrinomonadaceae bacterium]